MTPTTTGASLRLRDVAIRYPDGSTPVRGTDLDVAAGEIVALVGASGSGKSTILRGIAGLEDVVAGTVELDGRDVAAVPTHRRGVGMVFQDGQLFPHRTVGRNVAYGLESAGWDRARRRARVAELLDLVGLTELTDRPVQRLSGGRPSAWRWPGRWPRPRGCSCWTSRCPRSTRTCAGAWPRTSGRCCGRRGRPASSSPTTSRRPP